MNGEIKNAAAALEALLFIYGEPLEFKKITRLLGVPEEEVKKILSDLETALKEENRGLALIFSDDRVQLATKPQFAGLLAAVVKSELKEELSLAALETLSIVAYSGPILKASIDYARGVNSAFSLRTLLMRGLVERFPDAKKGNAFVYQPTFDFLRHLGISRKEELPEYEKFSELLKFEPSDEK